MIGEAEIDGVFIPYLLIFSGVAFVAFLPVQWALRRARFYQFVWHAGLFDTALYVIFVWLVVLISTRIGAGGLGA
jgi:protein AaeX